METCVAYCVLSQTLAPVSFLDSILEPSV